MKQKEKLSARLMRSQGMSVREIADKLNVSKGTVSLWVRDICLTHEQLRALRPFLSIDAVKAEALFYDGISYRNIALALGVNKAGLQRWFNRKGLHRKFKRHKACEFCRRRNHVIFSKRCAACEAKLRRYTNKIRAVRHLGGACQKCGLRAEEKDYALYEFHHLDDKDFTISKFGNFNWERIKPEIEKCSLLCSNCHRVTHSLMSADSNILSEAIKLASEL